MTGVTFAVVADPEAGSTRSLVESGERAGFAMIPVDPGQGPWVDRVNAALRSADTEFVGLISGGGRIADAAGDKIDAAVAAHPEYGAFFSDEAVAGPRGKLTDVRKPILSPERLRCQDYLGDLTFYRRTLFDELGGFDAQLPGAEAYDLALRGSLATSIGHIDSALMIRSVPNRAMLDTTALTSTRTALESHLAATGGGEVREVGSDGVHDTRRTVTGEPLISIVIPSRGLFADDQPEHSFLIHAVHGLMEKSTYRNFEVIVVLDSVADPAVVDELRAALGDQLRIVDWDKPFNFSEKVNAGALRARGDYVLLLNDDVEIIAPGWLEAMLALVQRPGAGMAGAMLYYEDGTVQHAGHAYYEDDASHIGLDAPHDDPGPLDGYRVEREVSGVTAACAMMPRAVFHEVGGLSNLLPGNFNDVDLCMKVTWLGYEIYWTPHAELYHFESKTRDAAVHSYEIDVAWGRWGSRMHDPRYWPYPHSRDPMAASANW